MYSDFYLDSIAKGTLLGVNKIRTSGRIRRGAKLWGLLRGDAKGRDCSLCRFPL